MNLTNFRFFSGLKVVLDEAPGLIPSGFSDDDRKRSFSFSFQQHLVAHLNFIWHGFAARFEIRNVKIVILIAFF